MPNYDVVLYVLEHPEHRLTIAERMSQADARRIMRALAGKGWQMERRPDVHTYGSLVLTMVVHHA